MRQPLPAPIPPAFRRGTLLVTSIAALLGAATVAAAATHSVCPRGPADYRSIQAAVDGAADGDVLELCRGRITESGISLVGRELTLRGQGQAETVVQAAFLPGFAMDRVFLVEDSIVAFEDLTIRNGRTIDDGVDPRSGFGAGLAIFSSSVRLDRCTLKLNIAQGSGGGAIAAELSSLEIRDSSVFGNAAWLDFDDDGDFFVPAGGLGLLGVDLVMERTQVIANVTNGNGGALSWLVGTGRIHDSTLAYNAATGVSFNGLPAGGGAVYAFFNTAAPLEVSNSTFSHNATEAEGSAILALQSLANLTNVTLTGNLSPASGALAVDGPTVGVTHALVAGNPGGDCSPTLSGFSIGGPNLDGDGSCPGFTLSAAHADLGPLRDNGGPTLTHAIGFDSDALDAGDDGVCAGPAVGGQDQRGVARPQLAACDLGAYELRPTE